MDITACVQQNRESEHAEAAQESDLQQAISLGQRQHGAKPATPVSLLMSSDTRAWLSCHLKLSSRTAPHLESQESLAPRVQHAAKAIEVVQLSPVLLVVLLAARPEQSQPAFSVL
jgi:hypothetical protein